MRISKGWIIFIIIVIAMIAISRLINQGDGTPGTVAYMQNYSKRYVNANLINVIKEMPQYSSEMFVTLKIDNIECLDSDSKSDYDVIVSGLLYGEKDYEFTWKLDFNSNGKCTPIGDPTLQLVSTNKF